MPCPRSYECTFGDPAPVIDKVLVWASTHDFLGDAIPSFRVSFAADHFAALLGADLKFDAHSPNTVWTVPIIKDYGDTDIQFLPNGYWWQRTVEVIRAFRAKCDGKLIISGCHLQGGLDCLAALRGLSELLLDLMDRPEEVKETLRRIELEELS